MLDRHTVERIAAASDGGPLIIALSGGGDSTALLHLSAAQFGPSRLHAVIIDHTLRDGSAADARKAADFARAVGVSAQVVRLVWPTRGARNQETARTLRYAALASAARTRDARIILVAHNADDQAETVFMRAAAGSSWRGLAGIAPMAPAPVWPEGRDVLIARPLLGARRAALRETLRSRRAEWIEDPANANNAYERVRTRARLTALETAGFDPMRLARLAASLRPHVEARDAQAAALIAAAVCFEEGAVALDLARWDAAPDVRLRALSVLIAAAAGAAREPAADAVARIGARLTPDFTGATLGGARLRLVKSRLHIGRDLGALLGRRGGARSAPPLALPVGVETIWDGRLALIAEEAGLTVAPCRDGAAIVEGARSPLQPLLTRRWLLDQHVRHRLGPAIAAQSGLITPEKRSPFTAP